MTVVADDPFWYAPVDTYEITVNGSGVLDVLMANPTENPVFPVWVLEAPGTWTVPDYSPEDPDKTITLPTIAGSDHLVVDTDPAARQLVSVTLDPVWSRMNGVRFRGEIPGYTNRLEFPVSVDSNAPRTAQLRLNRPFNRPWGA